MQLTKISRITGSIELVTGLHIGAGSDEMHIGGTDNPLIKNPVDGRPYIPGSSFKGKMRSLLEWRAGTVGDTDGKPLGFSVLARIIQGAAGDNKCKRGENILKLFGGAPEGSQDAGQEELMRKIGPSRLAFWDCPLDNDWAGKMDQRNRPHTEIKMENTIDRIGGAATNPRNTERVPAGAIFEFNLTMRVHDGEDLFDEVLRGLRLVELTGLGGSGSRGYGKLRFTGLKRDGESVQTAFDSTRADT